MKQSVDQKQQSELARIGDVAKATGISVYTLRMWERRYGAPQSEKTPTGHRRYLGEEISRLRLVKLALDAGHKPSNVVSMPKEQLYDLLAPTGGDAYVIEKLMEYLGKWDEPAILKILEQEWQALGPVGFVNDRATRFLRRLGEGWVAGEISVASEHFASQILEDFLATKWRATNEGNHKNRRKSQRNFLLATLEGELHGLGLHMAATVLATAGQPLVWLGTRTPTEEIVKAAVATQCDSVCISVSKFSDQQQSVQLIREMRRFLPKSIRLIIGGLGAPFDIPGSMTFGDFKTFYEWLRMEQSP